jgi:phospholipase/lecithinase/hemolysin
MRPITVTVSDASGGTKYSNLVRLDNWAFGQVGVQLSVTGTVNYTLQQTMDDPNSTTDPVALASINWVNCADSAVVGATATKQTNYQFAPIFCRVVLNSGSGSVTATFVQVGNVPA